MFSFGFIYFIRNLDLTKGALVWMFLMDCSLVCMKSKCVTIQMKAILKAAVLSGGLSQFTKWS